MRRAQAGPSRHRILASIPTGYPLNPAQEWVSIVIPQATTNLFLNPSFETNTSNWTQSGNGSGSSLARSSSQQCRGAYSGALTIGTSGTYVQIVGPTISTSTVYALSFHVRAPNGRPIALSDLLAVYNGSTGTFGRLEYIGNGWWRVSVVFTATATTAPGIRILGSAGQVWYVDACQLEASSVVTTYCDGDEQGLLPFESPVPFRWNGTPHASTSSRSGATRAGGIVRDLSYYGLTLVSLQGLGAGPIENVYTPLGNAPGAIYQTTDQAERTFTIGGRFEATDHGLLSRKRGALRRDLSAGLSGLAQPVRLILQKYRDATAIGDQVYADCSYAGGLEGDDASLYSEDVAIQFVQYQPDLVRVVSDGTDTTGVTSYGTADDAFVELRADGTWSDGGTSTGGTQPVCMCYARDGSLYVGWLTAGTYGYISKWDGSSWSALGTGLNAAPDTIVEGIDGSIYVGGDFTSAGGVANTTRIARWNGSAWSALGTGANGRVRALAVDTSDGLIYATGDFTTTGGSSAQRIGAWTGSAWSTAFATGLNAAGYALYVDPATRNVYVGGDFTTAGGIAAVRIASFTRSLNWSALSSAGANGIVRAINQGPDGTIYAGGAFSTIGGITASRIARWNGSAWSVMGSGIGGTVTTLAFLPGGRLLAAGSFSTIPGTTLATVSIIGALEWTGSAFVPIPGQITAASGVQITAMATAPDGRIALGHSSGAGLTIYGPARFTISDTTASTPYTVRIKKTSGSVLPLLLKTASGAFYPVDFDLLNGETVTISGDRASFVESSIRGSRGLGVLDGSSYAGLVSAVQDTVQILVRIDTGGGASGEITAFWYPRYLSFDDTVPGVE